jgi:glucose/arabinose dehydrogenase
MGEGEARLGVALLAAGTLVGLWSCGGSSGNSTPVPTPTTTAACSATPVAGTPPLTSTLVASGLSQPLDLQSALDDQTRIFVVEQAGRVRLIKNGALVPSPFLDITGRVGSGGNEQGLLGLALHPRFRANGRFFVNYTDQRGNTHIAEFRGSGDLASSDGERTLLTVPQPFANHNGGGLAFGNDGFLYVGLGDGGSAGDPLGNGQRLGTALGKLLRIDVDQGDPYGVPASNPFVTTAAAFPAIWAYGLRNPWRFAFDRETGDLYIGDVGQSQVEEVDVEAAPRHGGQNYGWNFTEGSQCYDPPADCPRAGITFPVVEYRHTDGCAVIGGVVYRGCRLPGYGGTYFYGDLCSAFIRSFRFVNGQATDLHDWTSAVGHGISNMTSFGTDAEGEIYIVDRDGGIYKIVPAIESGLEASDGSV